MSPAETSDAPADLVRSFCDAWGAGDLDAVLAYFAPDAVYHNIPVDPVTGVDAIRSTIEGFMAGVEKVEFRVRHLVAEGDVVLTERVDVFHIPGRTIELPVMGTFEIADGRIVAWRDYFDLQQFMSQLAG
jgi:limonene-1,2-epoxide hydrolase